MVIRLVISLTAIITPFNPFRNILPVDNISINVKVNIKVKLNIPKRLF